jgi:hypothetical protein
MYLGGSFLPIIELAIQTLNPYLVSQASSHIYLITEIIRNLKMLNQSFSFACLA